jgi:hypothetical protein
MYTKLKKINAPDIRMYRHPRALLGGVLLAVRNDPNELNE